MNITQTQTSVVVPVILSGGSGTRLWPKSRQAYPKQLHKFYGELTMLQHTVKRVDHLQPPIVVCNNDQRFMVADQLARINVTNAEIILEPAARNTAPAIAVAAMHAQKLYSNPILVVLAADHLIKDIEAFRVALDVAVEHAQLDKLVAFGVVPTHAETGYGYIKAGSTNGGGAPIERFVEKPDSLTAQGYMNDGSYTWNSGMFVFSVSELLNQFSACGANWLQHCEEALSSAEKDLDFIRLNSMAFSQCENISIDFSVMEKTSNAWVVPLNAGWSDLGSWEALWEVGEKDEGGNVVVGDVIAQGCEGSLFFSESRLVVGLGVKNVVVVDTADGVLVIDKSRSQEVKNIVDVLKENNRSEFQHHREVHRPWGTYDTIDLGERYQVKRIEVKPGASLSMHKHCHRAEHWIVVRGTALVEKGEGEEFILTENQSTFIPLGEKHRLHNPGKVPLQLIEVRSGAYIEEDDIERLLDDYGRASKPANWTT